MIRLQTSGGRKSRLLFTLLLFMSFSSCFGEQGYAVFNSGTGTLTFQYGTPTGTLNTDYYDTDNTSLERSVLPGWWSILTSITKVVFDPSFAKARPKSCVNWFNGCKNLTEIEGSNNLNTSAVTSMYQMFKSCEKLTSLDVGSWDTGNVTDMGSMFSNCSSLTSLDVTHFDTANVTSMNGMFSGCSGLTSLDVTHFNTANVTDMGGMFKYCSGLTSLDVTHFNTEKVTILIGMFQYCSGLTSLDVSNFNTANVTYMSNMFCGCSSLTSLDLSNFNTEKITSLYWMFRNCSSLTNLNVSNFNTANVTDMDAMFDGCRSLTSLDVSHFDTANVTYMPYMFSGCSSLKRLDLSNFNTEKVWRMYALFSGCSSLTSLDVSNFNTANVTDMGFMFQNCSSLTSLDVTHFNTAKVTSMRSMFDGCSGLTSLDVSNFNTANVGEPIFMFYQCSGLTSLTFGEDFSTAKVGRYRGKVFYGCSKLRYIDFYASKSVDAIKSVDRSNDIFSGVPETTVIYLPKGSQDVTNVRNVVYSYGGDETDLRCPNYYSEDKVDIELPREFKTTKAEYHRTMSNNYGSVVLPYDFTTDANIQAYTLDEEHKETMLFKDATTVAAHTPFAFKKLQSGNTADFVMTDEDFGITVKKTSTTSAEERGEPYTHNENLSGWTTKGYYIKETVTDFTGAFYIAGDKFYKASAALTLYPHRVTFHGAWTKSGTSGEAQFYNINTVSDSETITAIEVTCVTPAA